MDWLKLIGYVAIALLLYAVLMWVAILMVVDEEVCARTVSMRDSAMNMQDKQEFEYPIYKKSKRNGLVVRFIGLQEGEVVDAGSSPYVKGSRDNDWVPHTDDGWQDWTPPSEEKFEYPIYKKSKRNGLVVKFTGLREGEVVVKDESGVYEYAVGFKNDTWMPHIDAKVWQDCAQPSGAQEELER